MTSTSETVAMIGVGTMGHGMASSALRGGDPDRRLGPYAGGDPRPRRAGRGSRARPRPTRLGEPRSSSRWCTDADAVVVDRHRRGHAGGARARLDLGADEHDRRRGNRARRGTRRRRSVPTSRSLDAPVSGSKDPAEQGQLTIFASGPDDARARVAPLFDALGQRTIWVGPVGSGTRLKLVNNTWLAFGAEAVDASVALAHRLGLETQTMIDALDGGPLVSPWQSAKLQRIVKGDFSPQFALRSRSRTCGSPSRQRDDAFAALDRLADEWQQAVDQGLGDQDLTVVTQTLELQAGAR